MSVSNKMIVMFGLMIVTIVVLDQQIKTIHEYMKDQMLIPPINTQNQQRDKYSDRSLYKEMKKMNFSDFFINKLLGLHKELQNLPPAQRKKLLAFTKNMKNIGRSSDNTKQSHNNKVNFNILGKLGIFNFLGKKITGNKEKDQNKKNQVRTNQCQNCFLNNFQYIINQESYCKNFKNLKIIILISSAVGEKYNRMAVRETWATLCTKTTEFGYLFVTGVSRNNSIMEMIQQENSQYKDILQIDFIDSYKNLTYKTMSGIKWSNEYCRNSKYVMKTDINIFVNVELLSILLKGLPKKSFWGGNCWGISTPIRNSSSKRHVSFEAFSRRFPPMCSGTGYIFSMELVPRVLHVSQDIPFFHLEDVYTALCMEKLKIKPFNLKGFFKLMEPFDECLYRNKVIMCPLFDSSYLWAMWNKSRTCKLQDWKPNELFKTLPYVLKVK